MTAMKRVEAIATERNTHTLRLIAEAERTIARNHEARGAHVLAAIHNRTAERLNQLARRAPEIWADADRLAQTAENAAKEADRA